MAVGGFGGGTGSEKWGVRSGHWRRWVVRSGWPLGEVLVAYVG